MIYDNVFMKNKLIWDYWKTWHNSLDDALAGTWKGYQKMSDELDISIKELKKFMKLMRINKIGYHVTPAINSDCIPCGPGNFISSSKYFGMEWEQIEELLK